MTNGVFEVTGTGSVTTDTVKEKVVYTGKDANDPTPFCVFARDDYVDK